jgi:transposase
MAGITRKTKRYPSDMTDEEWVRIAPLMPEPEVKVVIHRLRGCLNREVAVLMQENAVGIQAFSAIRIGHSLFNIKGTRSA